MSILKHRFKPGTAVRLLDEPLEGTVVRGLGNDVFEVLTEDGFHYEIHGNRLIEERVGKFDHSMGAPITLEDADGQQPAKLSHPSKPHAQERILEIDLHFEAMPQYSKHCHPSEILRLQLNHLREQIRYARAVKIRRLIVIHGVGEGVLRENVITLLKSMERIEYFDASFAAYGRGATEVLLL